MTRTLNFNQAMRIRKLHSWDVTPKQAVDIQKQLLSVLLTGNLHDHRIKTVAGFDVSYCRRSNRLFAATVLLSYPQLEIIEESYAISSATFPYIPGLLAFREGPALMQAYEQLKTEPDALMFDGHGIAHPRGLGIASHIGVLLDKPSIGVGKTVLCGQYTEPGQQKGCSAPLMKDGREIGKALRTRSGVKPVFVSIGNKTSLDSATSLVLSCCRRYKLPEPVRQAHLLGNRLRTTN